MVEPLFFILVCHFLLYFTIGKLTYYVNYVIITLQLCKLANFPKTIVKEEI